MNRSDPPPAADAISAASGIRFPAVHQGQSAAVLAILQQLREAESWSGERIRERQMSQLQALLKHAASESPFYARRLMEAGLAIGNLPTPEQIERLRPLTRRELQESRAEIAARKVPPSHGRVTEIRTSGSTGFPVVLTDTGISALVWRAITLRDHLWHERDFSGSLAAIRWRSNKSAMAPEGIERPDWGEPVNRFFHTGPGYLLNSASDIGAQAEWLSRVDPVYLLSHPSNLAALAARCEQEGRTLAALREVRSVGESVNPALRAACRRAWGVPLTDTYSCQEAGYLALQCPRHEHYHVQSEHVYLEVVNRNNEACAPGEVGRVLVTSLQNFATPLIRYEIGDYAIPGDTCDCGRGLPVLTRVLGRVRNMLKLPSGEERWPNFGFGQFHAIADIRQFQVVQLSVDEIEFRVITPHKFPAEVEDRIRAILIEHLGHPFQVRITYPRRIERARSGKYEDFISLVDAPQEPA